MTLQEMVDEVRAAMGNRTDLLDARYVQWLNWSQYELTGCHKERMFAPRRFHILEGNINFSLIPYYTDQSSGFDTTLTYMVLDNPVETVDDAYNDCIVTISGDVRVIMDYTALNARAYVYPAFSQIWPAGTEYSMRQRTKQIDDILDPQYVIWTVERMELADTGTKLDHDIWDNLVNLTPTTAGTPTKFARRGNKLMFDMSPEEEIWLRMFYRRYPNRFLTSDMNMVSELPEVWHEAIVQGAVYRGFEKLMEPARATEAQARFVDLVINRRDDYEVEKQYQSRRAKMRLRG